MITTRRDFIKTIGGASAVMLAGATPLDAFAGGKNEVILSGHLWVYASKYPPDWNCNPILETVFSDFKYAGFRGLEVMESNLRGNDAVPKFKELIDKYKLPVTGASYYGDMWDKNQAPRIMDDITMVIERLGQLKANNIGITVGVAQRRKTEEELDHQAEMVKQILKVCAKNNIEGNLHNHTFEVADGMHDLKGTLARIPDVKLGPDLNWLIRGGVDPVWFIETYGHQMTYMHLRDQYANGKWTEYLGQGVTDFKAIAKALKKVNFKGRAAIELAFDSDPVNPIKENLKTSRQYVKKVFGW
ncbi:sugar phosphate isomerase/epimerase [Mucilaginibacter conchicola]|uniref:Sugar phosphate isomerase/epimerase n=1 Tax=Mucilaginibacter conchicola TaxID=2303333 RepID=A0A372P0V2_9SPHI|nr:sugar phosphate isomerase/epimerase family protein [Mucilaginibacter conchicola]RFZ95754.1 sugar phosphate isomerase/epimerase [Mucilaginibacter conchicola]